MPPNIQVQSRWSFSSKEKEISHDTLSWQSHWIGNAMGQLAHERFRSWLIDWLDRSKDQMLMSWQQANSFHNIRRCALGPGHRRPSENDRAIARGNSVRRCCRAFAGQRGKIQKLIAPWYGKLAPFSQLLTTFPTTGAAPADRIRECECYCVVFCRCRLFVWL